MGHMGTISAQVALRDGLRAMEQAAQAPNIQPYGETGPSLLYPEFRAHLASVLKLVNATVGDRSLSIRPRTVQHLGRHRIVVDGEIAPLYGGPPTVVQKYEWEAEAVVPTSDDWWNLTDGEELELFVATDDPWAGSLATYPENKAFGRTIQDAISDSTAGSTFEDVSSALEQQLGIRRMRSSFEIRFTTSMLLPNPVNHHERTLIVRKRSGETGQNVEYRLLADHVLVRMPSNADHGQYLASGGTLGTRAQRLMAAQPHNPVQPAFDGFGFPTQWVPPTDPAMFGGNSGESSLTHNLSAAKLTSQEAATAVQTAMESLIEQQLDEVQKAAADKRNAKVNELELASLCGGSNPGCTGDVATTAVPMVDWKDAWISGRVDVGGAEFPLEAVCGMEAAAPDPHENDTGNEIEYFGNKLKDCGSLDLDECASLASDATKIVLGFLNSFAASEAGMGELTSTQRSSLKPLLRSGRCTAMLCALCRACQAKAERTKPPMSTSPSRWPHESTIPFSPASASMLEVVCSPRSLSSGLRFVRFGISQTNS